MTIDLAPIIGAWPFLAKTLGVTVLVSLTSMLVGLGLGLLVGAGRVYGDRALDLMLGFYVDTMRAIPILVVLVWTYFSFPLLGGARMCVPPYASTPLLADAQAYVDHCATRLEEGFTAVKFHCWCEPSRDIPMVETVHRDIADKGVALMLDVEQRYTRDQALTAAKRLEPLDLTWFEAPLLDTDLEGYRELRRHTTVPIIPAGNTVLDVAGVERGLAGGVWSAARVDVTIAGGITPVRKIMALAEAHNTTCELQCWGYTLTQAANLHVMLAHSNCRYFEQPAPYPAFEYGALDVIRPDEHGQVRAPEAPGLGIGIDWPAVEAATIHRLEFGG